MEILKLNNISPKAGEVLKGYVLTDASESPVGVLVRSQAMQEWAVPSSLLAVARAGAGVNNVPFVDYAAKGICVFNTPGANANAVKELVIASLLVASRNLYPAITWAQTLTGDDVKKQVEKGKAQFAGTEIEGKTIGILGLGAIGRKVAAAANALGMHVVGYDPYLSQKAALEIPFVTLYGSMTKVYAASDYLTIHMPFTAETKGFFNAEAISNMKDGAIVINAARGELVDTSAIKAALGEGKLRAYVTDFPDSDVIGNRGIITTPHLGASTVEAEDNCAVMAAEELKDYIENGNVRNSVNLPSLSVEKCAKHRTSVIATEGTSFNAEGKISTSTKFGYTYFLIDSDNEIDALALKGVEGVIKVRSIY